MLSWAERIEKAKESGQFSADDHNAVVEWKSCAVGEMAGYPAEEKEAVAYALDNSNLFILGLDFLTAVTEDRIKDAESIYKKIHA